MRHALFCALLVPIIVASSSAGAQRAAELSDAQVRDQIIQQSIAAYKATGHMRLPLRFGAERLAVRGPDRLQPTRWRDALVLPA